MHLADNSVLVTGGAGLIDSFLVERLVAAGARMTRFTIVTLFATGARRCLSTTRSLKTTARQASPSGHS
jgi:nucleoside-diphosphate-sugar epimerase